VNRCWLTPKDDARKAAILGKIRQEGCYIHHSTSPGYPSAVAYPVFKGRRFVAAVGASMPCAQLAVQEQRDVMVRELASVAQTISIQLSAGNSI
jgi:DNA-binding IclR family transcriptional regulator